MNDKLNYESIETVFQKLHDQNIIYAVLRNYDNLLEDEIYMDGHGDIDLICADSIALAAVLEAYPHEGHIKNGVPDGVHYYIYFKNQYVSLDLRYVGDGYYCELWQTNMLKNRVLNNGFYVLNDEDHFYSLIYHAILQKDIFTEEYQQRLAKMGTELGINTRRNTIEDFMFLLEEYMKIHDYTYVYPKDKLVPFERKHIQDKSLLDIEYRDYIRHKMHQIKMDGIQFLVKIKHQLLKNKK